MPNKMNSPTKEISKQQDIDATNPLMDFLKNTEAISKIKAKTMPVLKTKSFVT